MGALGALERLSVILLMIDGIMPIVECPGAPGPPFAGRFEVIADRIPFAAGRYFG